MAIRYVPTLSISYIWSSTTARGSAVSYRSKEAYVISVFPYLCNLLRLPLPLPLRFLLRFLVYPLLRVLIPFLGCDNSHDARSRERRVPLVGKPWPYFWSGGSKLPELLLSSIPLLSLFSGGLSLPRSKLGERRS